MSRFEAARTILLDGTATAFPSAVVEVGRHDDILWQDAFGTTSREPDSPSTALDTVFDLASLTKVIATTTLTMVAVDNGCLALTDPVSRWLPDWRGDDRAAVTIEDLLTHASGLTAHLPFFRDHQGRQEYQHAICSLPLEYAPRSASLYSDLGFILLGFVLEDALGVPIDTRFDDLARRHAWADVGFRPGPTLRGRAAPTEVDTWRGRLLTGEVHDENAWALGGVAGHAGLFGTARGVGSFAQTILAGFLGEGALVPRDTFDRFATRSAVVGSSRALGWDTMLTTSSCGTRMSSRAIGHTGFTGTSLWVDPEADVYVVLLTNRVYPSRSNNDILAVRPALHDAVVSALD